MTDSDDDSPRFFTGLAWAVPISLALWALLFATARLSLDYALWEVMP